MNYLYSQILYDSNLVMHVYGEDPETKVNISNIRLAEGMFQIKKTSPKVSVVIKQLDR